MPDSRADAFIALLVQAHSAGTLSRLVLSKPRPAAADLLRASARPVTLKGEASHSFVYTHQIRDVTKNLTVEQGVATARALIAETFQHAHLFTTDEEI